MSAQIVSVGLGGGRAYDIYLGVGVFSDIGRIVANVARARRVVIVTQPGIARRWAAPVAASLRDADFRDVPIVTFPAGERYKTLATLAGLYEKLYNLAPAIDRKTLLVALGGGVVGDVVGFLAATYLRGMDYVQAPTTLLAMVDSSVGGKTGVDFLSGKNLIGAFHQPRAVVIDTDTLSTLPPREFRAGMGEVVKYGVIRDPALLRQIADGGKGLPNQPEALRAIIARCCAIKAEVVVADEFEETGQRAVLNYGHTVGHALESATEYRRFKHGEAIAIGMMAAANIGAAAGVSPPDVRFALHAALKAQGLPTVLPTDIAPDALLSLIGRDKKAVGGRARWVLARAIGDAALWDDISDAAVLRGLHATYGGEDGPRTDDGGQCVTG